MCGFPQSEVVMQYFMPIIQDDIIFSLDKIRFKFKCENLSFLKILKVKYDFQEFNSFKNLTYRTIYNFSSPFLNSSLSIGVDFISVVGKSTFFNFIEFNPNKIANSDLVCDVFKILNSLNIKLELCNYDIAVDFKIPKKYINLIKDRRVYKKFYYDSNNDNVTEYLGNSADVGRVKLYNKTIESKLNYDLTRLELTTNSVDFSIVQKQFPRIQFYNNSTIIDLIKLSKTDLVLLELIQNSSDAGYYLKRLGKDKRKVLEPYINSFNTFELSEEVFEKILKIIDIFIDKSFPQ